MRNTLRGALRAMLVILALPATYAGAQIVPEAGLRAEMDSRWDEAVGVYREALAQAPDRADLWVRIADIEALRGRLPQAIEANREAVRASSDDPGLHARLAAAHAVAGEAKPALAAIRQAVLLRPDHAPYLRTRAVLAAWTGQYALARLSYLTLLTLDPADHAALLGLARANAWAGRSNDAVAAYRRYLRLRPDDADAALEYARVEEWRGNYAAAVGILDEYRLAHGASVDYQKALARVLAATRPSRALAIVGDALLRHPGDAGLHRSRALALRSQFRVGPALDALATLQRLDPDGREVTTAEKVIRTPVRPALTPMATVYSDSDSLTTYRFAPEFAFSLLPDTRVLIGAETQELQARQGSGLEQADGSALARYRHAWTGIVQRLGPGSLVDARIGLAETAGRRSLPVYRVAARLSLHDAFRIVGHREHAVVAVSPRTIGDGLMRHGSQIGLEWEAGLRHLIEARGEFDRFSDGNERWAAAASVRRSVARRERLNFDLGLHGWWFGFSDASPGRGYYAPRRYEAYSAGSFAYWKLTDNHGLSVTIDGGLQRDDLDSRFRLGGNATVAGTFGLYQDWMLQVYGSATNNRRTETGAFRAASSGIALTRRF